MRRTHLLAASALTVAVASRHRSRPPATPPRRRLRQDDQRHRRRVLLPAQPNERTEGPRHLPLHQQGPLKHDFKIAGKKSRVLRKSKSHVDQRHACARAATATSAPGQGHSAAGMKGTFRVRFSPAPRNGAAAGHWLGKGFPAGNACLLGASALEVAWSVEVDECRAATMEAAPPRL